MPFASLALTGVTGHVGGRAARDLAARGIAFRMLARSPERVPTLPGTAVAPLTYGDPEQAAAALTGVEVLLMVSAGESADRLDRQRDLVDHAAAAGVRHVVYTSFLAAAEDATFTLARDHWATEQHLRSSGMAFTFLRDNFYADFVADLLAADGVIRGPAGEGAASFVARADVARSVVGVLARPGAHEGRTYDLTGPEPLTLEQAAATVTEVTGRPARYHPETLAEAYASRASYGAPVWQVDAWVSTYTAIASGALARVSDHVRQLTGRAPLSLAALLAGAD